VLDVFTRESLAIEVGQRLRGEDVVSALNQIRQKRGTPKLLFCDNGSEFTSQIMDLWAYHSQVQIDFSRPGKPTDNAHVESFNGTLRAECLDVHWFATLTEAKQVIEAWRREYNESRPPSSAAAKTIGLLSERAALRTSSARSFLLDTNLHRAMDLHAFCRNRGLLSC
jgi:putative transposase